MTESPTGYHCSDRPGRRCPGRHRSRQGTGRSALCLGRANPAGHPARHRRDDGDRLPHRSAGSRLARHRPPAMDSRHQCRGRCPDVSGIDQERCYRHQRPGTFDRTIAEYVLCSILMFAKDFPAPPAFKTSTGGSTGYRAGRRQAGAGGGRRLHPGRSTGW